MSYDLSIPSWSDFNKRVRQKARIQKAVLSIPSWSDFNFMFFLAAKKIEKLSIPSWSDFNVIKEQVLLCGRYSFNPILV